MFTFASIFLIMMVAQSFTQDRENGKMKRIRTTPTTPTEFMTRQVLSNMSIALIHAALIFPMTYVLGFRLTVGHTHLRICIHTSANLFCVKHRIRFNHGTIAKTARAATGLSFIFVLPQLFLGTFVGASLSGCVQVAGKFVPSYYVIDA